MENSELLRKIKTVLNDVKKKYKEIHIKVGNCKGVKIRHTPEDWAIIDSLFIFDVIEDTDDKIVLDIVGVKRKTHKFPVGTRVVHREGNSTLEHQPIVKTVVEHMPNRGYVLLYRNGREWEEDESTLSLPE